MPVPACKTLIEVTGLFTGESSSKYQPPVEPQMRSVAITAGLHAVEAWLLPCFVVGKFLTRNPLFACCIKNDLSTWPLAGCLQRKQGKRTARQGRVKPGEAKLPKAR